MTTPTDSARMQLARAALAHYLTGDGYGPSESLGEARRVWMDEARNACQWIHWQGEQDQKLQSEIVNLWYALVDRMIAGQIDTAETFQRFLFIRWQIRWACQAFYLAPPTWLTREAARILRGHRRALRSAGDVDTASQGIDFIW